MVIMMALMVVVPMDDEKVLLVSRLFFSSTPIGRALCTPQ